MKTDHTLYHFALSTDLLVQANTDEYLTSSFEEVVVLAMFIMRQYTINRGSFSCPSYFMVKFLTNKRMLHESTNQVDDSNPF